MDLKRTIKSDWQNKIEAFINSSSSLSKLADIPEVPNPIVFEHDQNKPDPAAFFLIIFNYGGLRFLV
jgi:hypothetical protein